MGFNEIAVLRNGQEGEDASAIVVQDDDLQGHSHGAEQ